jgi:hypothetical protein
MEEVGVVASPIVESMGREVLKRLSSGGIEVGETQSFAEGDERT